MSSMKRMFGMKPVQNMNTPNELGTDNDNSNNRVSFPFLNE